MSAAVCPHRRLAWLSVALCALCVTCALAVPAAAAAKAPPGFYGVTPTTTSTDTDLATMGRARVGTLRVMFNWGEIQPVEGGPYDFTTTDRIVARAAQQGIMLLPFLYGTPPWARECSGIGASYCDRVDPLRSGPGRAGWPIFARALAARYGPGGSFWSAPSAFGPLPVRPIGQWQVWNEPNSRTFFQPSPTPGAYAALLASTSSAIRSFDPSARIVLAGLFGTPPNGQSMPRFLRGLYRQKGVKSLFDAVAIHPYSADLEGIISQLDDAREILAKQDKKAPLMLTELGWGSQSKGKRGSSLYKGVKGQRSMLKSSFKLLTAKRKRYKLTSLVWFSWRDAPPAGAGACLLCESFGLLTESSQPKPSYNAFTRFTGGSR